VSVPVVLAIALDMQTALRSIAVGSGYHYTVKSGSVVLDPEDLGAVQATEVPYIIVGDYEPGARDFAGSRPVAIKDTFTFTLSFRVDAAGTDRARKATAAWNLYADIETVLAKDPQRGGLALYTYVQQPEIYIGGGPAMNSAYGEVPVEIRLQRAYGTP
jgi:hypothetical protein